MWHTVCIVSTLIKAHVVDKIIEKFFNKHLKIPRQQLNLKKIKTKNFNISNLKIEKIIYQIIFHFLAISWQPNTKSQIKFTNLQLKNEHKNMLKHMSI